MLLWWWLLRSQGHHRCAPTAAAPHISLSAKAAFPHMQGRLMPGGRRTASSPCLTWLWRQTSARRREEPEKGGTPSYPTWPWADGRRPLEIRRSPPVQSIGPPSYFPVRRAAGPPPERFRAARSTPAHVPRCCRRGRDRRSGSPHSGTWSRNRRSYSRSGRRRWFERR